MRRLLVWLGLLSALLLAVAVVWAYFARSASTDPGVTATLAAGTLVGLGAAGGVARYESGPRGLRLPDETQRLPEWGWWAPVGAVGLGDLVGGAFASPVLALVGAVLVAAAVIGLWRALARQSGPLDRNAVTAARDVLRFIERHGGAGEATIEYLGQRGARLVVVADDGAFGDVVLADAERAGVVAALAGVEVRDASARELGVKLQVSQPEWLRMAGLQLGHRSP